jgi:hypothetical protein
LALPKYGPKREYAAGIYQHQHMQGYKHIHDHTKRLLIAIGHAAPDVGTHAGIDHVTIVRTEASESSDYMPHRRRNNRRVTAIRQPCYAGGDQHGIREVCNKRAAALVQMLTMSRRCESSTSCGTDMGTGSAHDHTRTMEVRPLGLSSRWHTLKQRQIDKLQVRSR